MVREKVFPGLQKSHLIVLDPGQRTRLLILRILGGLWLLDGLLQLQPPMFTMAMLHSVMEPLTVAEPVWLQSLITWSIQVMTPHVAWWNAFIAALQLGIGLALLRVRRPEAIRIALWVSILWSAAVWLFGEGLGGVLTGSATVLSGAPGSVLLYGWVAVLLLLDPRHWQIGPVRFTAVRDGIGVFWALAAAGQLVPVFWQPGGLSSQFQANLMMQPLWLAKTIGWTVTASYQYPVLANLVLTAAMAGLAWAFLTRRWHPGLFVGEALVLLFIWWFGQGFGMLATGMATDPNTVPLLALLSIPAWTAFRTGHTWAGPAGRAPAPHQRAS
jgi:hypothetical protein